MELFELDLVGTGAVAHGGTEFVEQALVELRQRANLRWQRERLELGQCRGDDVAPQGLDRRAHRRCHSDLGGETDEEFGDISVEIAIARGDLSAVEVDDAGRPIAVDHHVGQRKIAVREADASEVEDLRPETGQEPWGDHLGSTIGEQHSVDSRRSKKDRATLGLAETDDRRDVGAGGGSNGGCEGFVLDSSLQTRERTLHL